MITLIVVVVVALFCVFWQSASDVLAVVSVGKRVTTTNQESKVNQKRYNNLPVDGVQNSQGGIFNQSMNMQIPR